MHSEDDTHEPASVSNAAESKEIQKDNIALAEVLMNEKFYLPQQVEALTKDLSESTKLKQKDSNALDEKMLGLKETLHAKIKLRSLKKELFNAEIEAANAKRQYYELKKAMLFQAADAMDFDTSDSEIDPLLENIKTKLVEEEFVFEIEERMLQEELENVQTEAANKKKEYYKFKSRGLTTG